MFGARAKGYELQATDLNFYFFVGNVDPHFLHTRTLVSPSILYPTLATPSLGQTRATLEMLMVDSCSAMPPLVRCRLVLLEMVFLTTRTCSTSTVPWSGKTRSTRCTLPRSAPVSTLTISLRRISKLGINLSKTAASF